MGNEHACLPNIVPIRTCVGCGKKEARSDLIRMVVMHDGSVDIDLSTSYPGRGAWIHADSSCLTRARVRQALVRALRITHPVDESFWVHAEEVVTQLGASQWRPSSSNGSGLEADGHPMSTQR